MSFYVIYAGETSDQHGLDAVRRPSMTPAVEDVATPTEIPGRRYGLTERSGYFKDEEIPVEFNYVTRRAEDWGEAFRRDILWLRRKGVLKFSDDLAVFHKVRYVTIGTNERTVRRLGRFTATFVCVPGAYYEAGARFFEHTGESVMNYYSEALPVYEITGRGACRLTVNGKSMEAEVDGSLTIDTDLLIAYKEAAETPTNTAVTGYYEDLHLVPGENTVTVTEGFTLRIKPNWVVV